MCNTCRHAFSCQHSSFYSVATRYIKFNQVYYFQDYMEECQNFIYISAITNSSLTSTDFDNSMSVQLYFLPFLETKCCEEKYKCYVISNWKIWLSNMSEYAISIFI